MSHYRGLGPPLQIHHVQHREGRPQLVHCDHVLEAQSGRRSGSKAAQCRGDAFKVRDPPQPTSTPPSPTPDRAP